MAQVQRLSVSQTNYSLFDPATAGVIYNASDATLTFSSSVPLNFSYAEVGTVFIVTATATDASGNSASCQFEVVVEGMCIMFIGLNICPVEFCVWKGVGKGLCTCFRLRNQNTDE